MERQTRDLARARRRATQTDNEALDCIVAGQRFDVILCDIMMPVVTGMDFYNRLFHAVREQAERVVFLTGGAFTDRAHEFLDRVPNACMEKPFKLQNLRVLLNERVRINTP